LDSGRLDSEGLERDSTRGPDGSPVDSLPALGDTASVVDAAADEERVRPAEFEAVPAEGGAAVAAVSELCGPTMPLASSRGAVRLDVAAASLFPSRVASRLVGEHANPAQTDGKIKMPERSTRPEEQP
jgi:hypothetical protein